MKRFISLTMSSIFSLCLVGCSFSSTPKNSVEVSSSDSETSEISISTDSPSSETPVHTDNSIRNTSVAESQTVINSEEIKISDISEDIVQYEEEYQYETVSVSSEYVPEVNDTQIPESVSVTSDTVISSDTSVSSSVSSVPLETETNDITVFHPQPNIYGYTPKYYQLNSEEQLVYDAVAKGLMKYENDITIPSKVTEKRLYTIFYAVMTTIEQQLYAPVREYTMVIDESTSTVLSIQPRYLYTKEEAEQMKNELESKSSEIMSSFTGETTAMDKLKTIHDSIILNCSYSDSDYSGSAYGALIKGYAKCEGYSRAMSYLCGKAGIPCEIITGTSKNSAHMWNMVEIDGKWYHIDVTWNDPLVSSDITDYISYIYFNLNDSQIKKTHTINTDFQTPVAYSTDANYFIYYNLYIDNAENYINIIKDGMTSAKLSEEDCVSFKFSDQQIFDKAVNEFFGSTWEPFFQIVDEYNSKNDLKIDKNKISIKKDTENFVIRINF